MIKEKMKKYNFIFLIMSMIFLFLISLGSARRVLCSDNPDYLYYFDEGTGNLTKEICYGINNGSLNNANWTINGTYGNALDFYGYDSNVITPNNDDSYAGKNLTVIAWIKLNEYIYTDRIVVARHKSSSEKNFEVGITVDNRTFLGTYNGCSGSSYETQSNVTLDRDIWYHVAYVLDHNVEKRLYVNGTLVAKNGNYFSIPSGCPQETYLGGNQRNPATSFNGTIDEIAIWHDALNSSQIYELYIKCEENWTVQYTSCNISDNRTKYYIDQNACGTDDDLPVDNGTTVYCNYCTPTWYCTQYNQSCGDVEPQPEMIYCINVSDYNYATCCNVTNLTSDCNFTGNYSDYNSLCGNITVVLIVPSYPYVDCNTSFPMQLYLYQNNISKNLTVFKINLKNPDGSNSTFNWTWDNTDKRYELTLLFSEEGNYPFIIYAKYPYDKITNITGTLIVKCPYFITFNFYETKNKAIKPYDNDFAYVTLEFKETRHYDAILENFISPLFFKSIFVTPVFHAPYTDGSATVKLWEEDEYALRLIDGEITFAGTYAQPNISKSYGTNMYIGLYSFNGTNQSYDIYVTEKDLNQYRWLLNWGFIICLVLIIAISIFMFFVIPEVPYLSFLFGIGFTSLLVLTRIVLFVWKGW